MSVRTAVCFSALLLVLGACHSDPSQPPPKPRTSWPPSRPGYVNPIIAENQLPGDPNFFDGREATAGQIEGYVDHISAEAGDTVQAMVSSDGAHQATWTLYRLGWYGGALARQVKQGSFSVAPQPACPMTAGTGLIQCSWQPSFSYTVPAEAVSGLYLFKFTRDDGFASFAPLVIKDNRPADILMQASADTYQAYSAWHGESLYADASGTIPGGMAIQVSFDRPYASDRGSGQVLRYEALFAAFLEHYGYDVTYVANPDVAAGGANLLMNHGVFISVGHDEYWAPQERDAVQQARDANVPVLFFGANVGYWRVRYEQFKDPTNPRVITCYKNFPNQDPEAGKADATAMYRDPSINDPENGLVGTMYESYELVSGPLLVADPSSFVFTGTGLAKGDTLPFMVGYEYDRIFDNGSTPPGTTAIAHSPVVDAYGRPSWSDAVAYHTASGSLVFGVGSIEWAYGLGRPGMADPRVERMTANILQEALPNVLPVPSDLTNSLSSPAVVFPPPMPGVSVQTVAAGMTSPTGVAVLPDGSFVVIDVNKNQLLRAGPTQAAPVTVWAGDGKASSKDQYDNVPGAQARFNYPTAVLAMPNGDVIVADTYNNCLRKVSGDASHTVTTVAGTRGKGGYLDGVGTAAMFKDPMGMAFDPRNGDIIVADSGNGRIRRVNTTTWAVTTEAGAGAGQADGPALKARMTDPTAVAVAQDGRIFIVSSGDWRVLMVGTDPQRTTVTIAGGTRGVTDGSGNTASLAPQGGALWTGTALLVSEPAVGRIRQITPGTDAASTMVQAYAGSGRFGSIDGSGAQVALASPLGMALVPNGGGVLVANGGDGSVRLLH